MSRSNPVDNSPNPATRFFVWSGAKSCVYYYDKEAANPNDSGKKGANVCVADGFTFIPLDELSCIKGYSKPQKNGMYSNEVRDTRQDVFVVKWFKSNAILAEGPYQFIKDKVKVNGGHFTTNIYIAYKTKVDGLVIAALQLKGAALGAWMEFKKKNKKALYEQAVQIRGFKQETTGQNTYGVPIFHLKELSSETNTAALGLDKGVLQPYLAAYLSKNKSVAAQTHAGAEAPQPDGNAEQAQPDPADEQADAAETQEPVDDGIPF